MTRFRWLVILSVMTGLLAAVGGVQAQTVPSQYFPLTGHSVRGEFLNYFNTHGGLELFGYPITEEFADQGRQVQYFQRMRLDAYPENPEPSRVQTGPLGDLLGLGQPPIPQSEIPTPGDPNRRYFPETGHTVVYSFLNYFNEHGGVQMFGYPITEYDPESGAQYFQRARMEWHPDLPPMQRVRLGNLGEVYAVSKLSPALLNQPPSDITGSRTLQVVLLKPVATLQSAITGRTGSQTLHVYVTDQHGRAVQNANVVAVVHFPSGDQALTLPPTDAAGHTVRTFDLGQLRPGQRIAIDVRVGFETLSAATRTSFLVWW